MHTEDVTRVDLGSRPFTITSTDRVVKANTCVRAWGAEEEGRGAGPGGSGSAVPGRHEGGSTVSPLVAGGGGGGGVCRFQGGGRGDSLDAALASSPPLHFLPSHHHHHHDPAL